MEFLSYKEPEHNSIFIVAVANTHSHEKKVRGIPLYKQFTVLMLLFQKVPHFVLPFSITHMNLHLDNMTRNTDYKKLKTSDQYMKNDVNHKLVPIQQERIEPSPQRQLYLKGYYTTAKLIASFH